MASSIVKLGECKYPSPSDALSFVSDEHVVLMSALATGTGGADCKVGDLNIDNQAALERAGPRRKIFFDPAKTKVGIVTCGGVCPGLNDVIREVVLCLWHVYKVRDIVGLKYGYRGLIKETSETVTLTADSVANIHLTGGTFLGSSRGPQDIGRMVDFLEENKFDILFTIGGDGTLAGANSIAQETIRRGLKVSIIGVPKTIDNDIAICQRTFGFETAVDLSQIAITAANAEAMSQINGIGLVKLMGRDSGFIAVNAALASGDVNLVLIPEVEFKMEIIVDYLHKRLQKRGHAVVVVAEGAGQHLVQSTGNTGGRDKSGNVRYKDIGLYLKKALVGELRKKNMSCELKFIDPSYIIRSGVVNPSDAIFCVGVALAAVHAAMTGRTGMLVGQVNGHFCHIPLRSIAGKKKKVNPQGTTYQRMLDRTGTPRNLISFEPLAASDATDLRARL